MDDQWLEVETEIEIESEIENIFFTFAYRICEFFHFFIFLIFSLHQENFLNLFEYR